MQLNCIWLTLITTTPSGLDSGLCRVCVCVCVFIGLVMKRAAEARCLVLYSKSCWYEGLLLNAILKPSPRRQWDLDVFVLSPVPWRGALMLMGAHGTCSFVMCVFVLCPSAEQASVSGHMWLLLTSSLLVLHMHHSSQLSLINNEHRADEWEFLLIHFSSFRISLSPCSPLHVLFPQLLLKIWTNPREETSPAASELQTCFLTFL